MTDPVAVVRRFNRSYTQRIGVLEDSFLGLGMPLGPARLLFEIGAAPAPTHSQPAAQASPITPASPAVQASLVPEASRPARTPPSTQALRERLGLDSGYLSRLLRRLERDGLIQVIPDPGDRPGAARQARP